jgi:hypothetical protein
MTGRAETRADGAAQNAVGRGTSRRIVRGPMGDRGMAAVELGVAVVALAAAILLAVARG